MTGQHQIERHGLGNPTELGKWQRHVVEALWLALLIFLAAAVGFAWAVAHGVSASVHKAPTPQSAPVPTSWP